MKSDSAGKLEKLGTTVDGIRLWLTKAWRIGVLMAKGAYLLNERRRLFVKLGEETYRRLREGEMKAPELQGLVTQLERLTKKVEIEEMLIRGLRFGGRERKGSDDSENPPERSQA